MRILLAMLAFAFAPLAAHAQSASSATIDSYGIYTGELVSRQTDPASGVVQNISTNIQLAAQTTIIPAQIGLRFGIKYTVNGAPAGAAVRLRKATIFPAPGLRKRADAPPLARTEYEITSTIGPDNYTGWRFDEAAEMVPGIWTLQIWDGQRLLIEKKFNVVLEAPNS